MTRPSPVSLLAQRLDWSKAEMLPSISFTELISAYSALLLFIWARTASTSDILELTAEPDTKRYSRQIVY